jgi:hypothetical protein
MLQQGEITSTDVQPQSVPVTWERNGRGHIVLTLTGLDLTGADEIARLKLAAYNLGEYTSEVMSSLDYEVQRMAPGEVCQVVVMPGDEIERTEDRTGVNLLHRGIRVCGYGAPIAGFIPRLREGISDEQMEELGLDYVSALQPLTAATCRVGVLFADRKTVARSVRARHHRSLHPLPKFGGFLFAL